VTRRVTAVLATAAALAGCGGDGGREGRHLEVFAASSLRGVLEELEPAARFTYGGSDDLAAQIRDGAPADVFLSAAAAPLERLRRDGLVGAPRAFASNRLVLVVPPGRRDGPRDVAALARPGLKLVLGAPGVPVGDYARAALARARVDVAANVVSLEQDAKGVLGKVALGEADAGIVYATDARAARDEVRTLAIPERLQPRIRYLAAPVERGDTEAAAAFLDRLTGEGGATALRAAGFVGLRG